MRNRPLPPLVGLLATLTLLVAAGPPAAAAGPVVVRVADDAALRRALADARPGTRVVVAPGRYRGGHGGDGLRGTPEAPIVIEAADPKDKPVFEGGWAGLHLRGPAHLTLRNLVVRGQTGNGINLDDGGNGAEPAHHVTLEGVDVADVGPRGNLDGLKASGVDDLSVRDCTFAGWGGQAIDMVGCHRVTVEGCTFRGKPGFTQSAGVQAKGGSSAVVVRRCAFVDAGERAVNLGGSTGPAYFRPRDATSEARDVTVEGCRFVGSLAPVNFAGVDGAVVRYNTIVRPEKWVCRILQENRAAGLVACRNGRFERNLVVFERAKVRVAVNVGPATDPGSFAFAGNLWFCADAPAASRPDLPTPERDGA
ncbi:MAG TPA: right-handed parallel beta-helix repeat-containing protein, partial [Humisphaera sp.]